ncbi:MAG: ATP synthase F1 subunit delta [Pseudomonadota bacterium]|nr:ATP synthase F1 subunit delta [Pseudomonadota bacterium]
MVEGSLARRYAKALLEIGREEGQVDRFGDDLQRFGRLLDGTPELRNVMSNPVFTHTERRAVLDRFIPGLALHPHSINFLRLLLDKERFAALPEIAREYRALADLEAGRVRATVTTAAELSPTMREAVTRALAQTTGKKVVLESRVDPSLLGGLVAQVSGRVYDASLRTRLERLQLTLVNPSQA